MVLTYISYRRALGNSWFIKYLMAETDGLSIQERWSTLKVLQWYDLQEKCWPWPPYCMPRLQLLIDFPTSSARTPYTRGGPLRIAGGGACSEKYAITQLITSRKCPVPLPSWVMYTLPRKLFSQETHTHGLSSLCLWPWNVNAQA